jgi:hypothetical protein
MKMHFFWPPKLVKWYTKGPYLPHAYFFCWHGVATWRKICTEPPWNPICYHRCGNHLRTEVLAIRKDKEGSIRHYRVRWHHGVSQKTRPWSSPMLLLVAELLAWLVKGLRELYNQSHAWKHRWRPGSCFLWCATTPFHPLVPDAPHVILLDGEHLCVEASPAPMTSMRIGF